MKTVLTFSLNDVCVNEVLNPTSHPKLAKILLCKI